MVLIVPLWNWNYIATAKAVGLRSFNRTFMELKYLKHEHQKLSERVLIVPLWNWNKVFTTKLGQFTVVLIVPLWNWNTASSVYITHIASRQSMWVRGLKFADTIELCGGKRIRDAALSIFFYLFTFAAWIKNLIW